MVVHKRCRVEATGQSMSHSNITPLFFQNGAKSGFEICFGPSTLGAGAKTRLESRIKKFTPHLCLQASAPHLGLNHVPICVV